MILTKPLEPPLGGGEDGATVKLHPLLCAEMVGPDGWFNGPSGLRWAPKALGIGVPKDQLLAVPIVAFLIEHPSAGPIMVDTGFHASVIDKRTRRRNLGPIGTIMAREVKFTAEQTAAAQVRALGVAPEEVPLVIMTHLHFDHASALADFPKATVIVTDEEWRSAVGRGALTRGYSQAQLDPRLSYVTLDFNGPGARAHGSFEKAVDLFGDGSLMLLSTPGHSAGHLSIIARLAVGEAFIAGDAIYTMATLREGKRPFRSEDSKAFERSLAAIQAYDREHPVAVMIPGHDMAQWQTLQSSYS